MSELGTLSNEIPGGDLGSVSSRGGTSRFWQSADPDASQPESMFRRRTIAVSPDPVRINHDVLFDLMAVHLFDDRCEVQARLLVAGGIGGAATDLPLADRDWVKRLSWELSASDDVGTVYLTHHVAGSGEGSRWDETRILTPPPPPEATSLSLTIHDPRCREPPRNSPTPRPHLNTGRDIQRHLQPTRTAQGPFSIVTRFFRGGGSGRQVSYE